MTYASALRGSSCTTHQYQCINAIWLTRIKRYMEAFLLQCSLFRRRCRNYDVECRCRIVDIGDIDMLWVTWPSVGDMHAFFRHLNIAFHPANQSWCTFHTMILMRITQFITTNALCSSPPNVKLSIRDLSQISTTTLIFMKTNYFRQDIWMNIWLQFHFQYIFERRVDSVQTRHIFVPPQQYKI